MSAGAAFSVACMMRSLCPSNDGRWGGVSASCGGGYCGRESRPRCRREDRRRHRWGPPFPRWDREVGWCLNRSRCFPKREWLRRRNHRSCRWERDSCRRLSCRPPSRAVLWTEPGRRDPTPRPVGCVEWLSSYDHTFRAGESPLPGFCKRPPRRLPRGGEPQLR